MLSSVWWCTPVNQHLGRWRLEDLEFKFILDQHGLHQTLSQKKQGIYILHQFFMIKKTTIGAAERPELLENLSLGPIST